MAYTTTDRAPLVSDAFIEHFRVAMPHHMVPRWFVHSEAFPATANQGKVDRVAACQLSMKKLPALSSMEERNDRT